VKPVEHMLAARADLLGEGADFITAVQ
jgi:hypothetical protein